ncbi:MAG TPA: hypothetical protein DCP92_00695 [Nitrospiraceae bacterium]|jgi:hypothetical protein|nr:hypothetical protein [Nitrospiraceae bacterium]
MEEKLDELKEFLVEEGVDAKRKIPIGWLILFWGLILWGIYYFVAYTPSISGWSQQKAYEESIKK